MDEQKARDILGDLIQPDGGLETTTASDWRGFVFWAKGSDELTIDADVTAEEVEAIAWWVKNGAAVKEGP